MIPVETQFCMPFLKTHKDSDVNMKGTSENLVKLLIPVFNFLIVIL